MIDMMDTARWAWVARFKTTEEPGGWQFCRQSWGVVYVKTPLGAGIKLLALTV